MNKLGIIAALSAACLGMGVAQASVPSSCRTIRLGKAGWVDNAVQNAVFSKLVTGLGYKVNMNLYSLEVIFAGLKNKQIDIFLDNWMPAEKSIREPYLKEHAIDVIGPDLTGAKYTLVVPDYLYKQGLKNFSDIHKFGKQLDYKIYGIDPGASGNELILKMIKENKFDLGKFHLVQSSSAGMLAEAKRKYKKHEAIVFLGWEPHPMNIEFNLRYLPGGDAYFGPKEGAATIYINTRAGYSKECPNVGKLLHQFRLTVHAENKMMYGVDVKKKTPDQVADTWLRSHHAWINKTLTGVTTVDGKPGAPAVLATFGS